MIRNDDILWSPRDAAFSQTRLANFAMAHGFDPHDYDTLHRWSVSDKGAFWAALWTFADVIGEQGEHSFVHEPAAPMTESRFFPGGRLNLAENLLAGDPEATAVFAGDETGAFNKMSRRDLKLHVMRVASALRNAGVEPGDRVAGIMPNDLAALVAMLASLAMGATWTACSPDFGAAAIIDRIGQIAPKILFARPHFRYGGKAHDIASTIEDIRAAIPSLLGVVETGEESGSLKDSVRMRDFHADPLSDFERFPYSQPAFILYTSGTTGRPKAIVHSAGGALLKHMSEHALHGDVGPDDTLMWYTNIAWMMYPWMLGAMACGAAVALYDGAPVLKGAERLECGGMWSFVERAGVTQLGVSPKYLATLQAERYAPRARHDLSHLRHLMVCGAPCLPHQFDWVYEEITEDIPFSSISGGTEILGCFLTGSPLHPVRRGQITVPALGMAVSVLDARGAPVIGQRGELVCTEPFPSMPLTFWGDGGRKRYIDTYFADRPEIWTHGDIAEITATGGAFVHGRSDTTINPGGVRIGTSEVYAICGSFDEIEDVLMFGAAHDGDEEVILAIKPSGEGSVDQDLVAAIRKRIRTEVSPRHVPARVHLVSDIPYTINGKRVEGAARAAVNGEDVVNLSSLANPASVSIYRGLSRASAL